MARAFSTLESSDFVNIGDRVTVRIVDVANGGHCIARIDDKIIFVRHALPDELGVVEITSSNSKIYRGDMVEVLESSPQRITPVCKYATPTLCGGCSFAHAELSYESELKFKVLKDQLSKIGKLDLTNININMNLASKEVFNPGDGLHWRTRMNFAIGSDQKFGLHSARSSKVLEIDHCFIASEHINEAKDKNFKLPKNASFKIPVEFSQGVDNQVTISFENKIIDGPKLIKEKVGKVEYLITPQSFWQSHKLAPKVLTEKVLSHLELKPADVVLDLYSGAGLFGAQLLSQLGAAGKVIMIESDSYSGRDAMRTFDTDHRVQVLLGKVGKSNFSD